MKTTILIKRYSNRKMYSVAASDYVTLSEISELIAGGADVLVVDDKTKADITEQVIAAAILKALKGGPKPNKKAKPSPAAVVCCPTCKRPID
jgi:polyhydroxyalkanoate synthesis repressor PhaR